MPGMWHAGGWHARHGGQAGQADGMIQVNLVNAVCRCLLVTAAQILKKETR